MSTTPEDSDVIERVTEMLCDLAELGYYRSKEIAEALAAAGLLTPSDTFASTKPSDADVALMRRAAASERAAERHWPADMLAQAADTIERLRTDLAANPDADVATGEGAL